MRRFLSFALILATSFSAFAQAKHPFTFEDMMKLKRVGDPQVSPDGKWVIFSVVDVDLEANTKTPHIWIVPLNHVGTAASAAVGIGQLNCERISSPIRMRTVRAGRRMGSGLRFCRRKKADRRFGSRILMAQRER